MSAFYDLLDEYLGDDDALTDIRVMVRRLWFYDFADFPLRLWQGKGRLFTEDGNSWIGTINAEDADMHATPALQDGRDNTSAQYDFSMVVQNEELYNAIKEEQWRVTRRNLTCYLAVFKEGEGLRPTTPIVFFKELYMMSPRFSETMEQGADGVLRRKYKVTLSAKDNNFGRSAVPNGTYADTIQKQRAREQGVNLDRGSEFLAGLANKTMQIP